MPPARSASQPPSLRLSALSGVLLAVFGWVVCAFGALAQPQIQTQLQTQPQPQPAPAAAVAPASRPASAKASGGSVAKQAAKPQSTRPAWHELTEAQRQALAPLSGKWATVSEAQKRKWLAMSQNFPRLSAPEQAKLHSRMTEWVALSPQQRTQARLNFGDTQKISPDDKKAKWEAYQALSPEEKKKLAAGASKPPPAAAAIKPVPTEKLAKVPQPKQISKPPRIAAGANQVDQNTLLPQPASRATN